MANFPTSIYAPRTKANRSGVVYDPTKTTRLFAEDVSKLDAEVVSLETILGLSPQWASVSIAERIKGIRSLSDANEAVITIKGANVGIGTTAPLAKLQVNGASQATGGSYLLATGNLLINSTDVDTINKGGSIGFSGFTYDGITPYVYGRIAGRKADSTVGSAFGYLAFEADDGSALIERMGIDSLGNIGIATTSPTAKADINSDILRLRTAKTPASAGAAGNAGDICWDASYSYVCVATNTWVRSALATW